MAVRNEGRPLARRCYAARVRTACILLLASSVAACGSTTTSGQSQVTDAGSADGGGVDAGGDDGASAYPAPHAAMPTAISAKGPVMTAPKVVAISFQGDSLQASIDTFVAQLVAATSYWS